MSRFYLIWTEDDGVLSFEWTLLLTLLTLGIVGGLAAARDAIIDELGDVAQAAQAFDQSYFLAGITLLADDNSVFFETQDSAFLETPADQAFADCERASTASGQAGSEDGNS